MNPVRVNHSKLFGIPQVSLLPGITCPKDIPCQKDCYATHGRFAFPSVQRHLGRNTFWAKEDLGGFFEEIANWLEENDPEYFRWHSAGDIPSEEYAAKMLYLALQFPRTHFLAFTKTEYLLGSVPRNLSVIFSVWPEIPAPDRARKKAWVVFKDPQRNPPFPENSFLCPGKCYACKKCWHAESEYNVLLSQH